MYRLERTKELFDSIATQNTEIRMVAKSLSLLLKNSLISIYLSSC
nr:MAG TPA: hypothetical protein [Caudoviricetes sp.]